jgi:hypothetical protein
MMKDLTGIEHTATACDTAIELGIAACLVTWCEQLVP